MNIVVNKQKRFQEVHRFLQDTREKRVRIETDFKVTIKQTKDLDVFTCLKATF